DLVGEMEQKAQATRDQLAAIREREAHELANMSQHARQLQAAGVLRDAMQIASGSQAARS
ncbi:hypothetical protein ACQZEV_05950, partial [Corynebacterium diphtheriae]